MTKVTQAHIDARTEDIKDAASKVFAQKGFARATVQDIATEAGISAGAIYRYFPSKEDIVGAMSEESFDRRDEVIASIRGKGDTLVVLGELADAFFSQLDAPDAHACQCVDIELWSEAPRNPKIRETLSRSYDGLVGPFAEIIRSAQQAGDINKRLDAESVARLMVASLDGLVIQMASGHKVDVQRYVAVLKAMMGGMFWTRGDGEDDAR